MWLFNSSLILLQDLGAVALAPVLHGIQDRAHALPKLRKGVLHTGRDLGVDGTGDDPIRLQLTQSVREHLLADALQALMQFVEAPWALHQVSQNQQLPLAPDELDRGLHRAIRQFRLCQHENSPFFPIIPGYRHFGKSVPFLYAENKKVRTCRAVPFLV